MTKGLRGETFEEHLGSTFACWTARHLPFLELCTAAIESTMELCSICKLQRDVAEVHGRTGCRHPCSKETEHPSTLLHYEPVYRAASKMGWPCLEGCTKL